MYLSIPSAAFKDLLSHARAAMGTKSKLPVLNTLHFRVPPDGLTVEVTSTDLDVSLTQTILLAEPGGAGEAVIHLAGLAAIRPDKHTPVRIDYAPHVKHFDPAAHNCQILYVSGGHSAAAELETADPKEFPHWHRPPGPEDFTCMVPQKTLAALTASIPFQSKDQTRYVLNGAFLSQADGGTIVATDGRRMAKFRAKALPTDAILPLKTCQLLAHLKPGTCAAALTPRVTSKDSEQPAAVSFRSRAFTVHSKLIEGNYPNYRQVIPAETSSAITFADPLGISTWLASLPSPKGASCVKLTPRFPHYVDFTHEHGRITATAYLQGEPPAIAFNPQFLADALTAIPGTLHLTDGMSPGVLRQIDALAVLMPMRVITDKAAAATADEEEAEKPEVQAAAA